MKLPAMKHAYRLPPCPDYDVEGTESWLTDMAGQGLHLTKDGFFFGVATFEKGDPQEVRYRLEAAPKTTSMWAEDGGYPDQDAVELSRDLGWEYVANRGGVLYLPLRCTRRPGAEHRPRRTGAGPRPCLQASALQLLLYTF